MSQLIILTGRVGKQPETRKFSNGGQVSNFSLAVSEKYKNKQGEKIETTEWFLCQVSDWLSEFTEKYVGKGDLLQVMGKQRTRKYEVNGQEKSITEIHVSNLDLLVHKNGEKKQEDLDSKSSDHPVWPPEEEDDLPF